MRLLSAPSSRRRALAVLTASVLALGVAPFVGTAFAAAPVAKSTSPQGGSRVGSITTVSATYDVPLDGSSTIKVRDEAGQTLKGATELSTTRETTSPSPRRRR